METQTQEVNTPVDGLLIGSLMDMVAAAEAKIKTEREAAEKTEADEKATEAIVLTQEGLKEFGNDWPNAVELVKAIGAVVVVDLDAFPNRSMQFEFEGQTLKLTKNHYQQWRLQYEAFHDNRYYGVEPNAESLFRGLAQIRPEIQSWNEERARREADESPTVAPVVEGPYSVKVDVHPSKLQDLLNKALSEGNTIYDLYLSHGGEYADRFHVVTVKRSKVA